MRPSFLDLNAVSRTVALAKAAKVPAAFVISQAVARSSLAQEAVTVVSRFGPILGVVHGRTLFASSLSDGRTAGEIEASGKANAEVKHLFKNLMEVLNG